MSCFFKKILLSILLLSVLEVRAQDYLFTSTDSLIIVGGTITEKGVVLVIQRIRVDTLQSGNTTRIVVRDTLQFDTGFQVGVHLVDSVYVDVDSLKFRSGGKTFKAAVKFPGAAGGEANTYSSPAETVSSFKLIRTKSGADLPFKNINEGSNITITSTDTTIVIASTGGSGEWTDFGTFLKPNEDADVAIHITDTAADDSLIIAVDGSGNVTFTTTTGNITWTTGNTGDASFSIPSQAISSAEILNATILAGDVAPNTLTAAEIFLSLLKNVPLPLNSITL